MFWQLITDIATEPAFSFSTPRQIHDLQGYLQEGFQFGFAVEPGTARILVARPVSENASANSGVTASARRLAVSQDFDETIRRLLPAE